MELALPHRSQSNPTRAEVIAALAVLHIEHCRKLRDDNARKAEEISQQIAALMLEAVRSQGLENFPMRPEFAWNTAPGLLIQFYEVEAKYPEIAKLIAELESAEEVVNIPDLSTAKKLIARQLSGESIRVKALLENPVSRQALEATLAELEKA